MYISLNKKFFLTILTFSIIITTIFLIIFDDTIGRNIKEEHSSLLTRNQYVIELLNENISLRKQIRILHPNENANILDKLQQKQEELQRERQLNEELNQKYNEKYAKMAEAVKIIGFGAALSLIFLITLWIILRRWVVDPLDRLTLVSTAVANGNFAKRLIIKKNLLTDEFDTLMHTVNFMLDNIENNISEIKQKEIFLQNLIDSLPDAVRIVDDKYNIILSNKAYQEYTQNHYLNTAKKCYQSYSKEATCPCSTSQYACPIKELKKSQTHIKLIHSINNRPLSISAAQIKINGKKAIVESFRDLSENIHFSHQQKISSLGFLATSLAHEMKNNLGAINIILNGLLQKYYKDTSETSEEKKYLEMVTNQIVECIKVPERLLKISRNSNTEITKFKIADSIIDVLSLLDYEIKSKGINLSTKFSNSKASLTGNETDFKMIILNLIQNAINAMSGGGELNISTRLSKDTLILQIKDSGCGIAKKDLNHIFEPFYSTAQKRGTGLGLAIVKDLVSKFDAEITVESKENVGSTFEITFSQNKPSPTPK